MPESPRTTEYLFVVAVHGNARNIEQSFPYHPRVFGDALLYAQNLAPSGGASKPTTVAIYHDGEWLTTVRNPKAEQLAAMNEGERNLFAAQLDRIALSTTGSVDQADVPFLVEQKMASLSKLVGDQAGKLAGHQAAKRELRTERDEARAEAARLHRLLTDLQRRAQTDATRDLDDTLRFAAVLIQDLAELDLGPGPVNECPDCGGVGDAIGPDGYYSCTRLWSCQNDGPEPPEWSDEQAAYVTPGKCQP